MDAWGLTDTGLARTQNQDTYQVEALPDGRLLAVICDGMGGARAGNVASKLAVDVFLGEIRRSLRPDSDSENTSAVLEEAVRLANSAVYEQSQLGDDFAGMGTTLVAAVIEETVAYLINVGDSRAYHIGAGGIRRITHDHSMVEMMVQEGKLSPEQAQTYPGKNVITRAVGTDEKVEPDLFVQQLKPGNCLYFCSDGLSNQVTDQEILFEIVHGAEKSDCCQRLLKIVESRGAPDNVTQILVTV